MNVSFRDISNDVLGKFCGLIFFSKNTVLSRIKTNIWKFAFSHVGIVYKTSSFDGYPRYIINYMDEIQGIISTPLVQFLSDPLLNQVSIRPFYGDMKSRLHYGFAKTGYSAGTMENYTKDGFIYELKSLFSLTLSDSNPVCSNVEYVIKTLLNSNIIEVKELTVEGLKEDFDIDMEMYITNNQELVSRIINLIGLEPMQNDDGMERVVHIRSLYRNKINNFSNEIYKVRLDDISKDINAEVVKKQLHKDRHCSALFLSGMFEIGIMEDEIYNHLNDEVDTTVQSKKFARDTFGELFRECKNLNDQIESMISETDERSHDDKLKVKIKELSATLTALGIALGVI